MKKYDAAIIGAGPAGTMAAITASETGKRVVLIDRNSQIGRKLLSTGNGRCNLTNSRLTLDRYHGAPREFIESILSRFDEKATMRFFEELGLVLKEEDNGRIFPRTNQASSVVEVLRRKLTACKVAMALDAQVTSIARSDAWEIACADGRRFAAEKLVLATGGRAAHHLGSTGDGLIWAKRLGHSVTQVHAALVPLETVEKWPEEVAGIKFDAAVRATCEGGKINESGGDLLFTSYGVSGPSVMALAGSIAPVPTQHKVQLHIDIFADMTEDTLDHTLLRVLESGGKSSVRDCLTGLLPNGLIPVMLRLAAIRESEQATSLSRRDRLRLVRLLKDVTLTVSKLRPLKEAQVSAGGIDSAEIDPNTLQSKLIPGLYFAGEILDVDADSGGFNLQWAWSSGRIAGMLGESV